jgi:hypothetical protein
MSLTMTKINKMNKEIDITIEKIFCSKCNIYHKRNRNRKLNKTFFNHYKFKIDISTSKAWKIQINKSFEKYSIKEHRKTYGSKKQ